jgi:hypothetical protein
MVKKKKAERAWSYKRAPDGWEVCLNGKSKGVVVKDGPAETPWRWKSQGKSEGPQGVTSKLKACSIKLFTPLTDPKMRAY